MARKPDAFEQMVKKLVHGIYADGEMLITKNEAIKLLRRYHARVRRMVANAPTVYRYVTFTNYDHLISREELLKRLDALKKGKL